ncbi:MAG: hypothetical protein GX623_06170 [Clostridiales bacterium]|nr:hypothetical protein [Clostridiales bacterium]
MLKKMVTALLLLSLMAGIALPALAENRDLFLSSSSQWEGGQVFSAAALGGTLYVLRSDGIYAVAPGAEPRMEYDTLEIQGAAGEGAGIAVTEAGEPDTPKELPPKAEGPAREGAPVKELPDTASEAAQENAPPELPPQAVEAGPGSAPNKEKPGADAPPPPRAEEPRAPIYVNHLFSDGERLYGLQADAGTVYVMENAGSGALSLKEYAKLEVEPQAFAGGEEYVMQDMPEQYLLDGGRLFVISRNYQSGRGEPSLAAWDLETGKKTSYEFPHVLRISSYKDGKLLALVLNEEDAWNPETGTVRSPDLYVFDPAQGTGEKLGETTLPFRGDATALAYDAALDMIYMLAPSKLYRRDAEGKEELAAYLSSSNLWGVAAGKLLVISPGVVAVAGMDGVFIRGADPAGLPTATLTLYGGWEDETFKRAAAMMPEVPVTFLDSKYFASAQELGQALVSGEDAIDVFILSTVEMDIDNLISKGYTLDLSGSPVISEHIGRLYPSLQALARRDGGIRLVPISMQAGDMMTAYTDNFKDINVEPPRSFPAFSRFMADWAAGMAEDYPDYIPVSDPDTAGMLVNVAMQLYINSMSARGEELRFNTPEFRALMGQVQEASDLLGDTSVDWSSPGINERMNEFFAKKPLMDFSGGMDLLSFLSMGVSGMGRMEPVFLSLKEGEGGVPGFSVTSMFVNPRSKNPELALRFVENYVSSLSASSLTGMIPDMNGPVPNPDYDRMLKGAQDNRDALQQAFDQAQDGPEKEELRKNLESFDKTVMAETESFRYLVTEEAIRAYREIVGRSFLLDYGTSRFWRSEELNSLLGRLRGKQITLEQFIQEADGKLRLMRLESQ